MTEQPPPKRKRGAPPGNTNALKHGYYSPRFGPPRRSDPTGVAAQIDLLRIYIRHIKELSEQLQNVHDQASLLNVLTYSMASLTRLIHIARIIPGALDDKEIARANIVQALSDFKASCAALPPTPSETSTVLPDPPPAPNT